MAFDKAREAKADATSYRAELRKARTLAVRLANKLMEQAIDSRADIAPEAIDSMNAVLRAANEEFGAKVKQAKQRPGGKLAMSPDEAREVLGG